jgi:hypothetical protein
MLAWRFTPLASLARRTDRQWLAAVAQAWRAPLLVIAAFVGGGLVVVPLRCLAATAAAFGPGSALSMRPSARWRARS